MTITLETILLLGSIIAAIIGFIRQAQASGATKQFVDSKIKEIEKDIEAIKKQQDRERDDNKSQHKDFYENRDRVTAIDTNFQHIMQTLGEIKEFMKRQEAR